MCSPLNYALAKKDLMITAKLLLHEKEKVNIVEDFVCKFDRK